MDSILNVDFEWFDPQPAFDFHGLKVLLRQLLDTDAHLFDLSALSDLILSQPLLGSTVKVDGNETDPYAFLSVLNLQQHKVQSMLTFFRFFPLRVVLQRPRKSMFHLTFVHIEIDRIHPLLKT